MIIKKIISDLIPKWQIDDELIEDIIKSNKKIKINTEYWVFQFLILICCFYMLIYLFLKIIVVDITLVFIIIESYHIYMKNKLNF